MFPGGLGGESLPPNCAQAGVAARKRDGTAERSAPITTDTAAILAINPLRCVSVAIFARDTSLSRQQARLTRRMRHFQGSASARVSTLEGASSGSVPGHP